LSWHNKAGSARVRFGVEAWCNGLLLSLRGVVAGVVKRFETGKQCGAVDGQPCASGIFREIFLHLADSSRSSSDCSKIADFSAPHLYHRASATDETINAQPFGRSVGPAWFKITGAILLTIQPKAENAPKRFSRGRRNESTLKTKMGTVWFRSMLLL
jgi:hypothetical protein